MEPLSPRITIVAGRGLWNTLQELSANSTVSFEGHNLNSWCCKITFGSLRFVLHENRKHITWSTSMVLPVMSLG